MFSPPLNAGGGAAVAKGSRLARVEDQDEGLDATHLGAWFILGDGELQRGLKEGTSFSLLSISLIISATDSQFSAAHSFHCCEFTNAALWCIGIKPHCPGMVSKVFSQPACQGPISCQAGSLSPPSIPGRARGGWIEGGVCRVPERSWTTGGIWEA